MAFGRATGYNNLPKGNFVPVIYSKKAQVAFRKTAVIQAITNTDYFGEIANFGDTVNIIKEPDITVSPYLRGQTVTAQDLDDEQIVLVVDKANFYAFKVDDLEEKQAHINWESMAANRAGYKLADQMDLEVLNHMTTEVDASLLLGTTSDPLEISVPVGSNDFSPLDLMNRMKRKLDEQDVPRENRWFVADPFFYELLGAEDSKLLNRDFVEKGLLRNGRVDAGEIRGFTIHSSNNLPFAVNGPEGTDAGDFGWLLAGHMSSTATAEQINKTESFRDPDSFADVVRGLHMYGRKVLRHESLIGAVYHSPA